MAALYVLFRTIGEALFLNILVLQLKGLLFLSVFLKHIVSSFPKLAFCLCDGKKKKKRKKVSTVIIAIKMEEEV